MNVAPEDAPPAAAAAEVAWELTPATAAGDAAADPFDPVRLRLRGHGWSATERARFGHLSYAATKARVERAFFRVLRPWVAYAKLEGADAHHLDEPTVRRLMARGAPLVLMDEARARAELRTVLYCRRRREGDEDLQVCFYVC